MREGPGHECTQRPVISGVGLALALLGGFVALGGIVTFVAVGTQRARVERLESTNKDLRDEITDEKRRHETTRSDLQEVVDRATRQQSVIDHLKGEVETMSSVFQGLSGPMFVLSQGQDYMASLMLQVLNLLGDQREHQTIAEALEARAGKSDD